jgi:hypothetical protein
VDAVKGSVACTVGSQMKWWQRMRWTETLEPPKR